jgi:two-component system alkaline phosphatase synthesis response regulator PhoP
VSARIAVVDDDAGVRELIAFILGKAGYAVQTFATPGRFLDGVMKAKPDLCLIDIQLPGMDGREVIRVLRGSADTRDLALIAMSAVAIAPRDAVRGLDDGADEYFFKPLDIDLLRARVANLLARRATVPAAAPGREIVSWGPIDIAPDEHAVTLSGKPVSLTNLEMKLLLAFLRQPGRVLPRSLLLQTVWSSSPDVATRTVDKHVETLRRKLPPFGKKVETVVGVGYLFRP